MGSDGGGEVGGADALGGEDKGEGLEKEEGNAGGETAGASGGGGVGEVDVDKGGVSTPL